MGAGLVGVRPGLLIADRYRLVERLGRARSAAVWLGWDDLLGRPTALKPVTADGDAKRCAVERAMGAARLTSRLQHANVVPIYDIVEAADTVWVVMPFVPSRSLQRVIDDAEHLAPEDVARLGVDLAAGLAATHALGTAHGGVTPDNVLVTEDGGARLLGYLGARAIGDTGAARRSQSEDVVDLARTLAASLHAGPTRPVATGALHRLLEQMQDPEPTRRPPADAVYRELSALVTGAAAGAATAHTARLVLPRSAVTEGAPPVGNPAVSPVPAVSSRALAAYSVPVEDATVDLAPAEPPQPRPQRAGRRSGSRLLVPVTSALLLAGVVIAILVLVARSSSPSAAPGGGSGATTAAGGTPTPPRTVVSRSSSPPARRTVTPAQLAGTVKAYYDLLPYDVPDAWNRLSVGLQDTTAGGYLGYGRFWATVHSVTAKRVVGFGGDRAEATIVFSMKDGRVRRERTLFGLVSEGRTLLIDSAKVVHSTTR